MTLEIRPVRADELPAYFDSLSTTFLDRPDVDKVADEVRGLWDLDRAIGAFDGAQVIPHGCDEHRPGALADADALFRTAEEPWSATFF